MSSPNGTHKASFAMTVGVVFNDEAVIERYLRPSVAAVQQGIRLIEIDNVDNRVSTNIASLYNVLLGITGSDIVALLHPDITFDPDFPGNVERAIGALEASGEQWGALGIVGRSWSGEYVWCHETEAPTKVCSLDSCSIITRRSLGIRFDQKRFDEFHCYVEDYCLQSTALGYGVYVIPATANHNSATMKVKGAQWGNYRRYRRKLTWKWYRKFGRVVTC